jgi:hypothetical protein
MPPLTTLKRPCNTAEFLNPPPYHGPLGSFIRPAPPAFQVRSKLLSVTQTLSGINIKQLLIGTVADQVGSRGQRFGGGEPRQPRRAALLHSSHSHVVRGRWRRPLIIPPPTLPTEVSTHFLHPAERHPTTLRCFPPSVPAIDPSAKTHAPPLPQTPPSHRHPPKTPTAKPRCATQP